MTTPQLLAIMAAILRSNDGRLTHAGAVAEAISIYRSAVEAQFMYELPKEEPTQ